MRAKPSASARFITANSRFSISSEGTLNGFSSFFCLEGERDSGRLDERDSIKIDFEAVAKSCQIVCSSESFLDGILMMYDSNPNEERLEGMEVRTALWLRTKYPTIISSSENAFSSEFEILAFSVSPSQLTLVPAILASGARNGLIHMTLSSLSAAER